MGRWRLRDGRLTPDRPTPGLRAALAARDVMDQVMAERARARREGIDVEVEEADGSPDDDEGSGDL